MFMEKLDTLDLLEIKQLCKKYGIGAVGDKKSLIKKLKYFLDPIQDVLNTHTGRKLPKEKEIVGVPANSTEKINATLTSHLFMLQFKRVGCSQHGFLL